MIWQNLRYSLRGLKRTPMVTATAVAALALGIGANTALFSRVNAVLLRPLSYPHPEKIVELMRHWRGFEIWSTTPTKFAFWQRENHTLEAVGAHSFMPVGLNLTGPGEPQRLAALGASADYFRVFGVKPLIGRTFTATEDKRGAGEYGSELRTLAEAVPRRSGCDREEPLIEQRHLPDPRGDAAGI